MSIKPEEDVTIMVIDAFGFIEGNDIPDLVIDNMVPLNAGQPQYANDLRGEYPAPEVTFTVEESKNAPIMGFLRGWAGLMGG